MIRLSKLSDYAVVVLNRLASQAGQVMSSSELAAQTGLSEPTVCKVLKILSKGGMIVSARGASGGYRMERSPFDITVRELITALEGPIAVTACLEANSKDCSLSQQCQMRGRWNKVNTVIMQALEEMPIADLFPPGIPANRPAMEARQHG